jgi:DNA-binding MarR family transcriptional regulator
VTCQLFLAYDAVVDSGRWLTEKQQRVWRRWLAASALLPAALNRGLQADARLSLPDFDVLVQLTDDPDGRVRVTDLARALAWERSRLSHHLTRMERRGLVRREECHDDRRGAFVVLTPEGRAAIDGAAPAHVDTVRSLVFDQLTDAEVDVLGAALGKVLARLDPGRDPDELIA